MKGVRQLEEEKDEGAETSPKIEPIHVISLGAGVQSSTMALMAAAGEIMPMPKCAIFADTQAEPKSVYTWLDWLEKELPFPVHRVTKGSLTDNTLMLHDREDKDGQWMKGCIPAFTVNKTDGSHGIMPRQCTYDYKVEVLDKEARRIAKIQRGQKTVGVIQWIGISLDEVHRMKTARHAWSEFRYPLIDRRMKRHDCLRWMQVKGYPQPPRSACVYCPYHSDSEWRRLRDEEPEAFAEAVRVDYEYRRLKAKVSRANSIPYLHASRVPLDQVDFSTDEDHGQQVMFGNECEGMCGV